MKAKGNRKAFEIGALVGALAYAIQAVSWMPHGASKLRVSIQCKHLHQLGERRPEFEALNTGFDRHTNVKS